MILDRVLYRQAVWFFSVVLLLAGLAFWPRYLSRLFEQPDLRFHLHAATMTSWCGLLIVQAYLIRNGSRSPHRSLGKLAYFLGPAVILTTLSLTHFRNSDAALEGYTLALVLGILGDMILFGTTFTLAMMNRKEPKLHARYILCTALVILPAILDRVFNHFPSMMEFLGAVGTGELKLLAIINQSTLAVLAILDWRSKVVPNVFARMFALFSIVYWTPFLLGESELARSVAAAFQRLPIL